MAQLCAVPSHLFLERSLFMSGRTRAIALSSAVVLACSALVSANTWTNAGGDNDWSNPANWDSSGTLTQSYIPRVFDDSATGAAVVHWPGGGGEYYPKASTMTFSRAGGFTIVPPPVGTAFFVLDRIEVTRANEATPYVMPGFINSNAPNPIAIDVATGSRLVVTGYINGSKINFTGAGTFEFRNGTNGAIDSISVGGGTLDLNNNSYNYGVTAISGSGTVKSTGAYGVQFDPTGFTFTGRVESYSQSALGGAGFSAAGTINGAEFFTSENGRLKSQSSNTFVGSTFSGRGQVYWSDGNNEYGAATKLTSKGSTWKPGDGVNSAGIIHFLGNLEFAKNAGSNGSLSLEIVGAGVTAGTDYDQLEVSPTGFASGGFVTSASDANNPLADVDLVLSAADFLQGSDLSGNTYTLVSAPRSDLTNASFGNITWNGLTGVLHYNQDSVSLTGVEVVAAPEPASLSLLALAGMMLVRRGRRTHNH
jgi:hypothetical protein